jgi:mRNA-degrading endonuclease RelE of RelBE toxin-antitoxin system
MRYRVIATQTYKEEKKKWSKSDQKTTEKIEKKLTDNPYVGDQCQYKFLREKRVGGKRIYFLVYDDLKLVLLVATSGKKDQQDTINHVIEQFDEFKELAKKIFKQLAPNDHS